MAASLVKTTITHVDTSHDERCSRDRVILEFSAGNDTFSFCNRTTEHHHIHMLTGGASSTLYLTDKQVRLLRDTLTDALSE